MKTRCCWIKMEYRDDDLEPVFKNSPSTNIPMSTEETFTIEETGPEYLSDNSDLFTLVKTWSEREAWTDLTVKRQTKLDHLSIVWNQPGNQDFYLLFQRGPYHIKWLEVIDHETWSSEMMDLGISISRKKKGQDSVNPKSSVHELFHQNGLVPDVTFGKKIPTSDLTMSTSHKKKGLHHLKYTFNLKTYINNKKNKRGDKWSRKSKSFQVTVTPSLCHQVLSPKVEEEDNKDYMTLSTLDDSNLKKEKLVHNVFPFSEDVLVKGDEMEDVHLVCPDSFFIM
eukprot:CAMPEP_0179479414 /NCGR_PEP_ID=MMETSP0799-20121207/57638_1 /TAXON_ID=46947 /ORGANISM="Geminigera cryophila, Strain CCMP2564" /LENGTH=280 /DNA_ID=CAMNT_0021290989 /DNA_START=13 /DNA_END=856 /DNA_ORIENTATION=-